MKLTTDDDVRRFSPRWLGPAGYGFPFHARYLSWGTWLVVFTTMLVFERVTPLDVGVPPLWEGCIAVLLTTYLMTLVDHDKPIRSLWRPLVSDWTAPRASGKPTRHRVCTAKVKTVDPEAGT